MSDPWRPPFTPRHPHVERQRQSLIRQALDVLNRAGFNSRTPVPGIGSCTPYHWRRTKNGPELSTMLAALDAAGYTITITKKDTVDAYEKVP